MSSPSNVSTVNLGKNSSSTAAQYFNNYFVDPSTISSNQEDAVIAYFQRVTNGNQQSAAVLASTVIYTALAQGINPMSIVQQFQDLPPGEVNLYLAMFLNLNRVGTSLVGINNNPPQNKYITRAILA